MGNPQPGDLLEPGAYVVQGVAADTSVGTAPGVDRVQVFFDQSRDSGGPIIGAVQAGEDGPAQRLTASGFAVVATFPDAPAPNSTHTMFVYARSASTGLEEIVSSRFK